MNEREGGDSRDSVAWRGDIDRRLLDTLVDGIAEPAFDLERAALESRGAVERPGLAFDRDRDVGIDRQIRDVADQLRRRYDRRWKEEAVRALVDPRQSGLARIEGARAPAEPVLIVRVDPQFSRIDIVRDHIVLNILVVRNRDIGIACLEKRRLLMTSNEGYRRRAEIVGRLKVQEMGPVLEARRSLGHRSPIAQRERGPGALGRIRNQETAEERKQLV